MRPNKYDVSIPNTQSLQVRTRQQLLLMFPQIQLQPIMLFGLGKPSRSRLWNRQSQQSYFPTQL